MVYTLKPEVLLHWRSDNMKNKRSIFLLVLMMSLRFISAQGFIKGEYRSYQKEYGPYKIRTNAWRWVEEWEQYTDEYGEVNWRKRKDKEGNIIKSKDAGLLIHGGGYSKSNLDNKKGANKYVDNTLGCIRISNLDVLLIVEILNTYMSIKKSIALEVI